MRADLRTFCWLRVLGYARICNGISIGETCKVTFENSNISKSMFLMKFKYATINKSISCSLLESWSKFLRLPNEFLIRPSLKKTQLLHILWRQTLSIFAFEATYCIETYYLSHTIAFYNDSPHISIPYFAPKTDVFTLWESRFQYDRSKGNPILFGSALGSCFSPWMILKLPWLKKRVFEGMACEVKNENEDSLPSKSTFSKLLKL